MTDKQREPSRDELLAMAYVDGELADDAVLEFERRLPDEPALVREVAELKRLEVIARQTAPPEPIDHEWNRLEKEVLHSGGNFLGFLLAALGTLGLSGWALIELFREDELGVFPKLLIAMTIGGFAILFLVILRARLRTLPYDPYTEVKR
jgi:hypothetical protein